MKDKNEILLKRLMKASGLSSNLSDEARDEIISRKKEILVKTLKHAKAYTPLTGLYIALYFALKRIGLMSILKSKIITLITVITTAIALFSSAILIKKFIIDRDYNKNKRIENIHHKTGPAAPVLIDKIKSKTPVKTIKALSQGKRVLFRDFELNRVSPKAGKTIYNRIARNLKKSVKNIRIQKQGKYDYVLFGTIDRVNNNYLISIKVIDIKSRSIKYMHTEEILDLRAVDKTCKKIAESIAPMIR